MNRRAHSVSGFKHQQGLALRLKKEQIELQKALDGAERRVKQLLDEASRNCLTLTSEEQVLLHRTAIFRDRLKKVRQALQRIRDGSFGMCLRCEEPIGEQRLRAMPSALYCVRCQHRLEQEMS